MKFFCVEDFMRSLLCLRFDKVCFGAVKILQGLFLLC